jgi:hypothetical protein
MSEPLLDVKDLSVAFQQGGDDGFDLGHGLAVAIDHFGMAASEFPMTVEHCLAQIAKR